MKIEIIPAIDLIGGECVRLSQGDYGRKTSYYKDPLDVALRYAEAGIRRLHLVDLDGAKASHPVNLNVLRRITEKTRLEVQYGGGIKCSESLESVFGAGARRAICGSIAVRKPELFVAWLERFGPERIVLGADVRNGRVAVNGWLEDSERNAEELIEQFEGAGLTQVICTDISKDGMLAGPTVALYTALQERFGGMDITVSGGVGCWGDIEELDRSGLRSVIVGKAIYEERISFGQLAAEIKSRKTQRKP